jgi:large subunit ribosomal protein L24
MKIKKGDRVVVLQGKDRGKEGVVMRSLPTKGKVIVEGINIAKKHQKPTKTTMQGGIIDKDMPLDVSNVALLCPKDGATRAGYAINAAGEKSRICRKCGQEI